MIAVLGPDGKVRPSIKIHPKLTLISRQMRMEKKGKAAPVTLEAVSPPASSTVWLSGSREARVPLVHGIVEGLTPPVAGGRGLGSRRHFRGAPYGRVVCWVDGAVVWQAKRASTISELTGEWAPLRTDADFEVSTHAHILSHRLSNSSVRIRPCGSSVLSCPCLCSR